MKTPKLYQETSLYNKSKTVHAGIQLLADSITSLVTGTETYTDPNGKTVTNTLGTLVRQTVGNVLIAATKDAATNSEAGAALITSLINVATDGVQIAAPKVDIAGAALFTSGRLSQSSLNNAYDAKGAGVAAAADKADKSAAVQEEQLIYISKASGTGSVSATTSWITNNTGNQNVWTIKRPQYDSSYPVLFVAKQKKTVANGITCSTPMIDETTTVIDGGHIITGTIDANKINASTIKVSTLNNDSGFQTGSQVSSAITAAVPTKVSDLTNDSGYQTSSQVSTAITNGVSGKADKTAAVSEEQLIYISKASGTNSVSATTTWVTNVTGNQNTWTIKRPTYDSSYPVLFIAKQKKTVSGTVTCSTPVKDDTLTVIDGGHITTGIIDASRIAVNQITVASLSDGSSYAKTVDIPTKVSDLTNDSGYQTSSQVSTAITNGITGKADKTEAVMEEQQIYISKAAGTNSVSATTTWVTNVSGNQNTWTVKRPTYDSAYPVLFVAKQKKTVSGAVTCTTPVKDDTLTVIDGGHITTGMIDASYINVNQISVASLSDGSDYAKNVDIPTAVSELTNDSGYQTSSQISAAITDGVSGKANRTEAVMEEQLIYISKASGTNSVSANTTWVTNTSGSQNTWTIKRPQYSSSYPVLFIAKQKKTVSGTVTCSTPIKDDTLTVIDGGHITTGTIDASRIAVNQITVASLSDGSDYAKTSAIPTKTSQLTNDSSYQTSSQVSTAITNGITGKADKTEAVLEEQTIYISRASNVSSQSANISWVTNTTGNQNTWTVKRPQYDSSYPVLFIAKQKKTVSGAVTCTTPIKDDTLTVIDGGHITTGTIDASRIAVNQITVASLKDGSSYAKTSAIDGKADKTEAVLEEQTVYVSRSSTASTPSANTSWVTNVTGNQNTWTLKRPTYNASYPVLFVAKQKKTVSGTVTCTTPIKDDTLTVIDGGHITTGTIDASRIAVNQITVASLKDGDDYAKSDDIPTKVSELTNDSGYQTSSQVSTAVTNGVSGKADKTDAVIEEQYVYKQATSGTNSMSSPGNVWVLAVGESVTSNNTGLTPAWTTKRPTYRSNYPVLFISKQKKTVSGTVSSTTPIKDDTLTIIDGGHITTGTIDASVVTVSNLDASKITAGSLDINRVTNLATELSDAKKTATNYLSFSSSTGLDVGYNATEAKTRINASGVAIYDETGIARTTVGGGEVRIGKASGESHVEIDYHSLRLIDKEGQTYFHVSDLRDQNGIATVVSTFVGDGTTYNFALDDKPIDILNVRINSTETTAYSMGTGTASNRIIFTSAPAKYAIIKVRYTVQNTSVKAYTLGTRAASTDVGFYSYALGVNVEASGRYSHAEGIYTKAIGSTSHAEGSGTTASGQYSHAVGVSTKAVGSQSYAEGSNTTANGDSSHACGFYTQADGDGQFVCGRSNVTNTTHWFIVGKGANSNSRSNAFYVTATGNIWSAGSLTQNSDQRLKEHHAYLGDDAVDFVRKLKPALFTKDDERHIGFYAQNVQESEPDEWNTVTVTPQHTDESLDFDPLTLDYTALIAPLVAYAQSLEKRIDEQEKQISNMLYEIEMLKANH